MLTDEQARELQAANAAMRRVLLVVQQRVALGTALGTLVDTALLLDVGRTQLELERATVRALGERVAMTSQVSTCPCRRCKRDRALLAQWAALDLEG